MGTVRSRLTAWQSLLSQLSPEEIASLLSAQPGIEEAIRDFQDQVYPSDPIQFARKVLGVSLWERQEKILQAVAKNRFVVVETGHGVGKSFAAAVCLIWWLVCHEGAIAITIAPTAALVQNILWRKVRELVRKAKRPLPGRILETPRWELGPNWFGIGISPKRERIESGEFTAVQGFHAERLLVILDEAGGLPRSIYESAESLVTSSESRLLAIGNPIGETGPFYAATRSSTYTHIRISCLDHPNVVQRREVIPGAVSYAWVRERFERWATPCPPDDPEAIFFDGQPWRPSGVLLARVLGIPPRESEMALVSLAWLEEARLIDAKPAEPWVLAIDPAHGGNARSAFVVRAGPKVMGIWRRDFDAIGQIGAFALHLLQSYPSIQHVVVDAVGIGAGLVDWLRERGINVRGVNGTSLALRSDLFTNQRSELYWKLRELLKERALSLPEDELLDQELLALRYELDSKGRIGLEPKPRAEDRLGRSFDSSDALALSLLIANERVMASEGKLLSWLGEPSARWTLVSRGGPTRRWRI